MALALPEGCAARAYGTKGRERKGASKLPEQTEVKKQNND